MADENAKMGVRAPGSKASDEKLKVLMAMSLLILKNIHYDDHGEEKSLGDEPTEIECLLK